MTATTETTAETFSKGQAVEYTSRDGEKERGTVRGPSGAKCVNVMFADGISRCRREQLAKI